jgi:hypothetical protein
MTGHGHAQTMRFVATSQSAEVERLIDPRSIAEGENRRCEWPGVRRDSRPCHVRLGGYAIEQPLVARSRDSDTIFATDALGGLY